MKIHMACATEPSPVKSTVRLWLNGVEIEGLMSVTEAPLDPFADFMRPHQPMTLEIKFMKPSDENVTVELVDGDDASKAMGPDPTDDHRYIELGKACEQHGLAHFDEDGTMRFQAPPEIIRADAIDKFLAGRFGEPVAYRVKDFADDWILVHTEAEAYAEADGNGNIIEPLFAGPAIPHIEVPDLATSICEIQNNGFTWTLRELDGKGYFANVTPTFWHPKPNELDPKTGIIEPHPSAKLGWAEAPSPELALYLAYRKARSVAWPPSYTGHVKGVRS